MDIIKLIKENDLVKVALVLLAIYLYITYYHKYCFVYKSLYDYLLSYAYNIIIRNYIF